MSGSEAKFHFGRFAVDCGERLLLREGHAVALTPKVFDALVYLVTNQGRLIGKSELMEKLWPGTFIEDGTLVRTISDLRKALEDGSDGQKLIETVPKYGYRFIAPVAIARDREPKPTGGKRYRLAALVLVGGLALASVWLFAVRHRGNSSLRSVAVLPLRSLGSNSDGVLELGIPDTVISRLSRCPVLQIRSIGSVTPYSGPQQDPLLAGRELKVDAVLEGTLQHTGDSVRVSLRLLNTKDGRAVWTSTFNERASDLFALEDSIALRVAGALAAPLAGSSAAVQRPIPDPVAHRLYLEGRFFFSRRSDSIATYRTAIQRFEQAVQRDPDYADAHAALAETLIISGGYSILPQQQVISRVREQCARALELDPGLAKVHRVLAVVAENYDYDRRKAEEEYKLALDRASNDAITHHYYGEFLGMTGRFAQAEQEMQIAFQLDPVSLIQQSDWAFITIYERKYRLAVERAKRVLRSEPQHAKAHWVLAMARLYLGDDETEALADTPRTAELDYWHAMYQARDGHPKELLKFLEWVILSERYVSSFPLARLYAAAGQPDQAIDALEKLLATRDGPGLIGIEVDPTFDSLRSNPRFQALETKLGAVEPEVVRQTALRAKGSP
jgi:adenylate cyclase